MQLTVNEYLDKNSTLLIILLCITTFAVTYFSPVDYTDSDPFGTFLPSQAILEYGTIRLDAYSEILPNYGYRTYRKNDHDYYYSALGTPLLATPFVWLANLRGEDMSQLTPPFHSESQTKLQNLLSALTTSIACLLIYAICRCYLNHAYSFLFTLTFVFGSSIASLMGTALWNHNFEVVFILCALLILTREDQKKDKNLRPFLLGLLLFLAYLCRPSAAIFILTTLVYVFLKNRPTFIKLAATLALLMGLFILFSMLEFNQLLPDYYTQSTGFDFSISTIKNGYGVLFSPSRGLLIYSPYMLIPFTALILFIKQLYKEALVWFGLIWFTLFLTIISSWYGWWGGWGFGPRLLTDVLPALLLLTVMIWQKAVTPSPKWLRELLAISFFTLALVGVFINTYQGLYNQWPALWNWATDIDNNPYFLFSWKYPQFLANPDMIEVLEAEREYNDLNPYKPGQEIFPHSRKVIFLDWHPPEGEKPFRWSDGKSANILLKVLPRDFVGINNLAMVIEAGTYQPNRVNVLVNGIEIGVIESHENLTPSIYTFTMDRLILGLDDMNSNKPKRVEIKFLIPDARIPAIVEPQISQDLRVLGISLYEINIVPEE